MGLKYKAYLVTLVAKVFLLELAAEVLVGKVRRVVVLEEVEYALLDVLRAFPVAPEPLWGKAWHTEDAKVNENANFPIVIPLKEK